MKKSIQLIAVGGAFTLLLFACKKDSTATPASSSSSASSACKLVNLKGTNDTLLASCEYNTDGKLSKFTYYNKGVAGTFAEYTYSGSTITESMHDGASIINTIFTTGSNGYVTLSVYADSSSSDSTTYTYDSNGYLTSSSSASRYHFGSTYSRSVYTSTYTYSNGDLITQTNTNSSGGTATSTTYTYSDKIDKIGFSHEGFGPNHMFGKGNTHLPAGHISNNTTYTDAFELNSDGLPTKDTEVSTPSKGTPRTQVLNYTFSCK